MEKHFMIDIETTGIDPAKEDLLQIGVLEADFENGYWKPGRTLEIVQHTDRKPTSEFAKKHMAALYELCNRSPLWKPEDIRWRLLQFLASCGATPPNIYFMGWNASNFDIPFLTAKGVLIPSYYEADENGKDVMKGDFHYRIYELGGSLSLVQNLKHSNDRKATTEEAAEGDATVALPAGKEHDAIYDCYKQLKILNGLIRMARGY